MSGWGGSSGGGLTPDFDFKASVRVATVVALPAYVQAGNVLTEVGVGALPLIDGVALVVGNRILVKNEGGGTSIANGIYVVTDLGSGATPWILTRSADADTDAEVTAGMVVPVEEGTVNADTLWILATNNPIVLNVTPLTFVPFITPTANASTVVKGVVEIGTQAETYAGTPYLGGTGAVLVPSITNLLVRRQDPANALYTIATGVAPAARGTKAIDFQSYRTAAGQVASGLKSAAFGIGNIVSGYRATGVGNFNTASSYEVSAVGCANLAVGGGTRQSAFGFSNECYGSLTSAFGYQNQARGYRSSAFGSNNRVSVFGGFSATKSSGFGYGNTLASISISDYASAFGYKNTINSSNANAFGRSNTIRNAAYGIAVGAKNLVGSAAFAALFGVSAIGYSNTIANLAPAPGACAFGRSNIVNTGTGQAFGADNLIGVLAFSATSASAVGNLNRIGQTAIADKAGAFGFFNQVNSKYADAFGYRNTIANANYGSAFGAKNLVGSVAYSALKSSAFGYGNLIGQLGNANGGTAVGYKNVIDGLNATAMGYSNVCYGRGAVLGYRNRMQAAAYAGFAVGGRNSVYSNIGSAFGYRNTVGVLGGAYTATKSSAFGYKNQIAQTASANYCSAFGYKNEITKSSQATALGSLNLVGSAAYYAFHAIAAGYNNKIGQSAQSSRSGAFGHKNVVDAVYGHAVGYLNTVNSGAYSSAFGASNLAYGAQSSAFGNGNFANGHFASSFGRVNHANGIYASAFGHKNLVGYGAFAATKSSAHGYYNKIAQNANSDGSAAFGYLNTITNGTLQFAFGGANFIGTAAFAGTKVSAFGYGNRISIYANTLYGNAVGFQNRLDNANYGSSFGSKNRVGYTGFTALKSSAFGYANQIGQTANANFCTAVGHKNKANAIYCSSVGYKNYTSAANANAFGEGNRTYSVYSDAFGSYNKIGGTYNGAYSAAFGYFNKIAEFANAASAVAFGRLNRVNNSYLGVAVGGSNLVGTATVTADQSTAMGLRNQIGQFSNSDRGAVVGYHNYVEGSTNGFAFGGFNYVGTATQGATKASSFGYGNRVANLVTSLRANAFGFVNTVNNAQYGCAFGGSNIVGSAAFAATKGSAFGYKNRVGNTAAAINGNAFGYNNQVNAQYGCAFGGSNQVFGYRSASFGFYNYSTASQATAFGVFNYANSAYGSAVGVGNSVSGYKGSAFGYGCNVTASGGSAFGYNAINRIATTTVVNGPIMVRKDNGDGTTPALRFQIFNGAVVVLESQEIDFTGAPVDFEIALPAGVTWFFNEIDLKTTNVAALATQPTVRAGIAGGGANSSKYLAPTLTTLLTAAGKRERYQTLLADDGESSAANLSVGFTVAAGAGTFKGRFILMGILEETQ